MTKKPVDKSLLHLNDDARDSAINGLVEPAEINFAGIRSVTPAAVNSLGKADATTAPIAATARSLSFSAVNAAVPVTIANAAILEIDSASAQSVTFAGTTGTLKLDDALAFTGQVSGLTGSDALDLADVSYGTNTTATFSGNTTGGTLTVTNGTQTVSIALQGDYLSSYWTVSSDGNGGTVVVDPVASNNWQDLKIGAGGWITGIDIAPDDTMVIRTDTYGAYLWNGTQWQQLVTATSMPAAFVTPDLDNQGVYEIQVAPSNSNILYMMFDGYIFKSTNKGTTWTQTSFAQVSGNNPNDPNYKLDGQKMAVDPNNPNIVYVGTTNNGLFVTTNGGTSWQSVSGVPASLADSSGDYPGFSGIVFDPALGVTGGNTNTIFAASYGHGVYESTNGGASWSSIGGPSDVQFAAVSSTGVYYAINAQDTTNSSLWSYQNGKWTELYLGTSYADLLATVAVDPFNPNEIVTQSLFGQVSISYNAGATWTESNYGTKLVATDIPWLADASTNAGGFTALELGGTVFDQLVPNKLWNSDGTGVVYTTNLPTANFTNTTPVVWNDQSVGIEQLVANEIIVPPGGNPVLASWDRPFFYISNANAYPSTYGPADTDTMVEGWSVDYASSDPSFIVGLADNGGVEKSGYSTNGGQTWTVFPSFIPGAGGSTFVGGTIAASTPSNIIWAPADGQNPYYTLNGGTTWNPITLPGVSSWSGFDYSQYFDARTVTADRVLSNTFYLYYANNGVYKTTNGGATWTQVFNGSIAPWSTFNAELESVPSEAGNLFFTGGPQASFSTEPFMRSTNGGATWTAIPNVTEVYCFGFGAPAPGQSYPSIYIVGYVNSVYGIWQSINNAQSWTQIGTYPQGDLDLIKTISGDPNNYGQVYVGFGGSGYAYLSATSSGSSGSSSLSSPTGSSGSSSSSSSTGSSGSSSSSNPTGSSGSSSSSSSTGSSGSSSSSSSTGSSGSSSSSSSTGSSGSSSASSPTGSSGSSSSSNPTGSSGSSSSSSPTGSSGSSSPSNPTGSSGSSSPSNPTGSSGSSNPSDPTVQSLVESPASGDLNAGKSVTLTLKLSEVVTVANGKPTLTLNDGGTATYTGGSGTNALTFSYTVAAGQSTSGLAATAVNLNSATVIDRAGKAANFSLSGLSQRGPQIDSTTPTITSIGESPASGHLNAGKVLTITLNMSEVVTVNTAGGTPTITLNDGGTATYTGGSGTHALTFSYTVRAGQNTSALAATAVNLNAATAKDNAGNAANLSLTGLAQRGPQIETTTPTDSGSSGATSAGSSGSKLTTPTISSFSPDGGKTFGGYTNAHALTISGTAAANSKVEVFDKSAQLGIVTANGSGHWSYTTPTISNGAQSFTAKGLNAAGSSSAASAALTVTVVTTSSLSKVGNHYDITTATSDPTLKYKSVNVTAGEFGSWTPIGAVQTASGYEVAWKNTSTGQYTVWTTNGNGNYTGNLISVVPANSSAWESIAPLFSQLNGGNVIDPITKLIQKDGSTSLTEVANQFYLDGASESGPALKYKGANVPAGEFGGWTPIGAVKTASGYDVAWKNTTTGQYTVWATDPNGNYTRSLTGAVAGTSSALESLERIFGQDLNHDGVIGPITKAIQKDGSTSLTEVANQFYLDSVSGSGPALKYKGANVTAGEFGGWTPIGAVKTASGYDVAWKNITTGQYTVWATDPNGNYTGNLIGAVSGTSTGLESLERIFGQDLNGDRAIGLYAAPNAALKITSSLAGSSGSTTIGTGATLEIAAADSAPVTFQGTTGTLRLDQASSFSGEIFGFRGNGTLSGSDHIDLRNIKYNSVHDSYANGVLTVTDGHGDTAKLRFNGSYTLANFKFASDGSGGAIVYDPPVLSSSSQNPPISSGQPVITGATHELAAASATGTLPGSKGTSILDHSGSPVQTSDLTETVSGFGGANYVAFGDKTTLGYLPNGNRTGGTLPSNADGVDSAKIALLGNYMASSFAMAGDNHSGTTVVADGPQSNAQSLLSNPHHA